MDIESKNTYTIGELEKMPPEILVNILSRLKPIDLVKFCSTSKRSAEFCKPYWKDIFYRDFPVNKFCQIYYKGKNWQNLYKSFAKKNLIVYFVKQVWAFNQPNIKMYVIGKPNLKFFVKNSLKNKNTKLHMSRKFSRIIVEDTANSHIEIEIVGRIPLKSIFDHIKGSTLWRLEIHKFNPENKIVHYLLGNEEKFKKLVYGFVRLLGIKFTYKDYETLIDKGKLNKSKSIDKGYESRIVGYRMSFRKNTISHEEIERLKPMICKMVKD